MCLMPTCLCETSRPMDLLSPRVTANPVTPGSLAGCNDTVDVAALKWPPVMLPTSPDEAPLFLLSLRHRFSPQAQQARASNILLGLRRLQLVVLACAAQKHQGVKRQEQVLGHVITDTTSKSLGMPISLMATAPESTAGSQAPACQQQHNRHAPDNPILRFEKTAED